MSDETWSLPGYRIGPVLGRGGFATVYRAEQLSLQRTVAVEVLTVDLAAEADRRRFDRDHPHVVDVHDAGGQRRTSLHRDAPLRARHARTVLVLRPAP